MNGKIFHQKGEAVIGKTKQVLKIVIFVAIATEYIWIISECFLRTSDKKVPHSLIHVASLS